MGTTLSVTLGNVFARVIDTALNTITQHAGDAIERADILNNFPIQMANFGYATSDAETAIDKLHDAVLGLPTALDTIANATARLAPMRSSLGDATDLAIALNNAIVAGGQSTVLQKNAMEQFSQMLAVNKVDVVAWRSVINAMPAQMQQLTDSILGTGHSVWDLYEAMKSEDGKSASVTFEDFIEHLMKLNQEGINGLPSLAEQARNATFGIGTAMQNVQNRLADAGARIIDGIGRDRIATAINDVSKQFGGWADKTVGFIQAMETPTLGLAGSMLTLGSTIKNVIVQSGNINTQSIVDAMYTMSDILDNHISPFISGFGGRLTSAVATLRDVLSEATRGFLDWYSTAKNAFNQSRGDLSAFGHGALELARQMGRDMLPVIKLMTTTYIPLVSRGLAAAAGAAQTTYNRIYPSLSRIARVVIPLIAEGIQLVTERFGAVSDVIDTLADLAATAIEDFGPYLVTLAREVLPHVDEALKAVASRARNVYDAIVPAFKSMADAVIPALANAIDRVIMLISSPAIERVAVTISEGIAGVLYTVVEQLNSVFDILEDVEDLAADVVDAIVPRLTLIAQTVLPRIVKIVGSIVNVARNVFDRIAPQLGRLADYLIPAVGAALDTVVALLDGPISDAFTRMANVAGDVIGAIADRFPVMFEHIMGVVNGPLADSFGRILDAAMRCIETIGAHFPEVLDIIIGFIEGPVANAFVKLAGFAADVVTGIADRLPQFLGYVERLWGVIVEIGNAIKPVIETLFGGISENAFLLLQTVLTTLFGSDFSVADPFGDVNKLDYVLDSLMRIADIITGSLAEPFGGESGKSFIISFISDVAKGLGDLIETITFLTRTVLVQLRANLETIWGTFTENGGLPTVSGIFETIGKVITFVVTNVMDLFQAITNGIASLKPEVIERIKAAINRIGAALAKLWADNKGTILNLVERTVPLLAELLAVVAEGIAKIVETMAPNINDFIQNKLPGLMTKLSTFVSDTLPDLLDKVAALMGWLTPDRVWTIMKLVAAFMAFKGVTNVFNGAMTWLHKLRRSFDTLHEMSGRLSEFTGAIKSKLFGKELVESIDTNALTEVGETLGETITDGVAKGIAGSEDEVIECVATIIDDDMPSFVPTISQEDLDGMNEAYQKMQEQFKRLQPGPTFPMLPEGGVLSQEELARMKADVDNLYGEMFKAPERLSLPESTFPGHEDLSWMQDTTKAAAANTTVTADNFERMQDYFAALAEDSRWDELQDTLFDGPWLDEVSDAEWSKVDKELQELKHKEKTFESLFASDHTDLDGMNAIYQKIQKENERLQSIKMLPSGYVPSQEELADMHGVFQKMQAEYKEFYQSAKLLPSGYVPSQEELEGMREAYEKIFNSPKLLEGGFSTEQLENMRKAYEEAFGGVGQKLLPEGGISTEQLKGMREAYENAFSGVGQKLLPGEVQEEVQTLSGAFKSVSKNAKTSFGAAKTSAIGNLDSIGAKIKGLGTNMKGLGSNLVKPFATAKSTIAGHLASIGTTVSTAVAPKVASIGTTLGTSLGSITGSFAGVGTKILSLVSGLGAKILPIVTGLGKAIVAVFTGPVGVAALIVAALVGAFVAFTPEGRKVFDDFVGRIKNLWEEKIAKPFNSFMETVKQVYEEKIKPHVDNLMKALEPAAKIIADTIGDAIEGIFDFVKGIFDFLNSPEGKPVLDTIAEVIGIIIDAVAMLVRWVMTVFSIVRRLAELLVTVGGNLIKAVHNFFDSVFNGGKDQWGYGEWTEPLHALGEDITGLWKDDKSVLSGPMNALGEGLVNATDAIKENTDASAQSKAQGETSAALKETYETTEAAHANNIANSTYPLNTTPVQVNIDGKRVAQATTPAITTAGGTYVMSYSRGM